MIYPPRKEQRHRMDQHAAEKQRGHAGKQVGI
jgi:hypothetical protein